MIEERTLTAISLFTGAGGLDFGLEAAGYKTAVAVEIDAACCSFLRRNRSWPVIEEDIHNVSFEKIGEVAGIEKKEADILIGGPPCQPFSKSGYWATGDSKRLDDERADTLSAYLRILEGALPRCLLLENVPGLAYKNKAEGLERLLGGIERINAKHGTRYEPVWQVIDAAKFGVPQHRERIFIVAARDGGKFEFPNETHGQSSSPEMDTEPFRTAWDAIGDLPSLPNDPDLRATGKWAELLSTIPEGENYLWHTRRGGGLPLFGWRTRYWNFLLKLAKDRPSWTIQAQPGSATGPFHWSSRKLSALEMARLQTFPSDVVFTESRAKAQRLLGNAVPSLVSEVLGRAIATQFLGKESYEGGPKLLPPVRANMPGREEVRAVGRPYLALIDDHEDHPGVGKGSRASLRASAA